MPNNCIILMYHFSFTRAEQEDLSLISRFLKGNSRPRRISAPFLRSNGSEIR